MYRMQTRKEIEEETIVIYDLVKKTGRLRLKKKIHEKFEQEENDRG